MDSPEEANDASKSETAATPDRYIILDTNIISSFSNDDLGKKILDVLNEVIALGYGLAVSDITIFEANNGTTTETEVKMNEILGGFQSFEISKDILFGAAHIGGMYKAHNYQLDQFGVGDQVIAATSILRNAIIFTKNGRDFPQPLFKEIDRRMIEYTSKEYPVCVPMYFMEPQIEYIGEHYGKRLEAYNDKVKKDEERKALKKAHEEKMLTETATKQGSGIPQNP